MTKHEVVHKALAEVYGEGGMVKDCAAHLVSDKVEQTQDEYFRTIWWWFPGGSTAEYAATKVWDALLIHGLIEEFSEAASDE